MPEEKIPQNDEDQESLDFDDSSNSSQNSVIYHPEASDDEFFDLIPSEDDGVDEDDDDDGVDDNDDADKSFFPIIDIKSSKKKLLHELRSKVEDAIINNYIYGRKNVDILEDLTDVKIWGVPLLPSKGHEGTDIVLMKFLKAKKYRLPDAFRMLRKTMRWRRDLGIDEAIDEEFDNGLESTWSIQGKDYEGRPVCYYRLGDVGVMKCRELRNKCSGTKEKCTHYIRWRFHCVERAVREIMFREGAANSIIQIIDLKNAHSNALKELRNSINWKLMLLIHEHYPGLLHKNIFINAPVWYMAVQALNMKHITKRTKQKYVFVRSVNVTKTLLKLLLPEIIPAQYGGLRRENDNEFSADDKVLEANAKASWTTYIKIPVNEVDVTVTWDLMVVGLNVLYKEEFVPIDDCSYKILIQAEKKMQGTLRNSFHIREPGNIVITIVNRTFEKKKVFYRHKSKPSIPLYLLPKSI